MGPLPGLPACEGAKRAGSTDSEAIPEPLPASPPPLPPPPSPSFEHWNACVSDLVEAVVPWVLLWIHFCPLGPVTQRLNSRSVTGATYTQRWPLYAQPLSTLTSTSAFSRSKNQSRPA